MQTYRTHVPTPRALAIAGAAALALISAPAGCDDDESSDYPTRAEYGPNPASGAHSGPDEPSVLEDGESEAERPSTDLPPYEQAKVAGLLRKDQIREVVRDHIDEVRECYDARLAAKPDAAGRVAISFTIGAEGSVTAATVESSSMDDEEMETCVADTIRSWVFPAPEHGGPVVVTYPFNFDPA